MRHIDVVPPSDRRSCQCSRRHGIDDAGDLTADTAGASAPTSCPILP